MKRCHELNSRNPKSSLPSARSLSGAETLARLDKKLPKILEGEVVAADTEELRGLAHLCGLPCRQLYAASARLWSEAFAADPRVADDLLTEDRYNASCAAALAAAGQGKDAANLGQEEYARLRWQALVWLLSDLDAWRSFLQKQGNKVCPTVRDKMWHWQHDSDFSGVRGEAALTRLPQAERRKWLKLWQDVAELERRAAAPSSGDSQAKK
jgi:serine/threonine-protein kinase